MDERLDLNRQRTVGELLSETIRLFGRHAGLFLSVSLIVVVPYVLFMKGVWGGVAGDGIPRHSDIWGAFAVTVLGGFAVPVLITALHAVIVREIGAGRVPSVGEALGDAAPRMAMALLTVLIGSLFVFGALLFVLPGIWLGTRLYFGAQAAVLEGTDPMASLKRSSELVRGRWWRTFGRLLASVLVFGVASAVASRLVRDVHPEFVRLTLAIVIEALSLSLGALFGTLMFFGYRANPAATPELQAA
jgi:hypothetical protein